MPKARTTLTVDQEVLKWVKVRAARTGQSDSEVIEQALRKELGLDLVDRLWSKGAMDENQAVDLAVKAQHLTRRANR